jgi:protein involved in polysaccharide export with SLBB domain
MSRLATFLGTAILAGFVVVTTSDTAGADDPLPAPRTGAGAGTPPRPVSGARLAGEPGPSTSVAVSSDYRLASGDEVEIEISLPAAAEAENPLKEPKRVIVAPGGTLSLPKIRGVRLDARSVAEVEADVRGRLQTAGLGAGAEVFVRVTSYAPRFVYLVGAAYDKVQVSPFQRTLVLHVLAEVGKQMENVDGSRVRVLSAGGQVHSIDVSALLAAGSTTPESFLDPGDIVILAPRPPKTAPQIERVYVAGAVKQPGPYAFWLDDAKRQPITLLKALAAAGWATQYGRLNRVFVRRFSERDPSARQVNVERIIAGDEPDLVLQPDDFIYVMEG